MRCQRCKGSASTWSTQPIAHSNWVRFFAIMNRPRITTLLFDLGNVLFDLDIPATEKSLSRILGDQTSEFKDKAIRARFFEQYETGRISDQGFIAYIQSHSRPGTTEAEITSAWNAMLLGMPADRLRWLKELRKLYRVALLSNTNALHITWVRNYLDQQHGERHFEENCFDRVYYSHEIGARKPNQAAFQHVLDDLGISPSDMLFIDDIQENTRAALSMGIASIAHPPGREIMEALPRYIRSVISP